MTEKWDEIQGKLDLVRVRLSKFVLSGCYCSFEKRTDLEQNRVGNSGRGCTGVVGLD